MRIKIPAMSAMIGAKDSDRAMGLSELKEVNATLFIQFERRPVKARSLDSVPPTAGTRSVGAAFRCLMIRKLKTGQYRLYSRKRDPKSGKRHNLGTFDSFAAAKKHEKEVQYFKRHD